MWHTRLDNELTHEGEKIERSDHVVFIVSLWTEKVPSVKYSLSTALFTP